jgi:hypothetical protein
MWPDHLNSAALKPSISQTSELRSPVTGIPLLHHMHHQVGALVWACFHAGDRRFDDNRVVAVRAPAVHDRMIAQQSMFTIHGAGTALEKVNGDMARLLIPAKAKVRVKNELYALGISLSTLFPDLPSLAADIQKRAQGRSGLGP